MDKVNKFKEWFDKQKFSKVSFCRLSRVHQKTLQRALEGLPIVKKPAAKKLIKFTHGLVTLEDVQW